MEGVVQCDDGGAALAVLVKAVLSRQLDEALVGLAAAVGKEHVRHAGALGQHCGQPDIGFGVEEVGDVGQLGGLFVHRLEPVGVAVADAGHADAAGEVDVGAALGAVKRGPLAVVDDHVKPAVGLHDALVVERLDLFRSHGKHPFRKGKR